MTNIKIILYDNFTIIVRKLYDVLSRDVGHDLYYDKS